MFDSLDNGSEGDLKWPVIFFPFRFVYSHSIYYHNFSSFIDNITFIQKQILQPPFFYIFNNINNNTFSSLKKSGLFQVYSCFKV